MDAKHSWSPTIDECIKLFLDEQTARMRLPRTITHYRQRLSSVARFLSSQSIATIADVTPQLLKRYFSNMQDRGLKDHTIATDSRVIKSWLNYLVEAEIIDESPMKKVKLRGLPKLVKHGFTVEEVKEILSVANDREELVVYVLIDTGLRSAEMCRLNVGDIDLASGMISVKAGKGRKDRTVFIGNATKKCLIRYWRKHGKPEPDEPLIRSRISKDGRLTKPGLLHIAKSLGRRSGVTNCTVHRFRRTFAQWSLSNDMDIRNIQLLLGHSDIRTTQIYLGDDVHELKRKHDKFGPVDHSGI